LSDSPDGHLKRATVFGRSLLQFVAQDLSTFVDPKHARPSGGAVSGVTVSNGGTVEVVGGIGMPPGVKLSTEAIAQSIHMKTADPTCCCCTVTRRPLMTLMIVAGSAETVIKIVDAEADEREYRKKASCLADARHTLVYKQLLTKSPARGGAS
jgi:hypothetical protein